MMKIMVLSFKIFKYVKQLLAIGDDGCRPMIRSEAYAKLSI